MAESLRTTSSKTTGDNSPVQSLDKSSKHPNSIYISSKSESQSYREKIRKRFKLIKKHASSSSVKVQSADFHGTIKSLKEVSAHLEMCVENRTSSVAEYSRTDCYHFFCEETTNNNARKQSICETGEDEDSKDEFNNVVHYVSAEVLQDFLKLAKLESLWYPRRYLQEVILKDNVRSLEDEGFYISKQKENSNLKLLEQRLARDDINWFNCEGNLKLIESPMSNTCYRLPSKYTDHFETEMVIPKDSTFYEPLDSIYVHKLTKLEIYISQINFQHHPLFSIENVFERKLLELYEIYKDNISNNRLERINKRLDILRNKTLDCGDAEITSHFSEIKRLRELQISKGHEYRKLLKNILQIWKTIKKIRKDKHFSNTGTKLMIYKEKHNYQEELRDYEKKIDMLTLEIMRECKEDYLQKLQKYKNDLEIWHSDKSLKKPKKPYNEIVEDEIRENVSKHLVEAFKPPGEPTITLDIQSENEITSQVENNLENLRRNAIAVVRVYLKILFNGIEVCKSKPVTMNNTFTCIFNETFSLQIKDAPKNITIQLYEQSNNVMKRKLADVNVDISSLSYQAKIIKQHFTKEELIHYNHEGIGSGCNLSELCKSYNCFDLENEILNTCGSVSYSICYDNNGHFVKINNSLTKIRDSWLDVDGHVNITKLAQWTTQVEIDPLNPKNACLFDYIGEQRSIEENDVRNSTKKYFRCNPELLRLEFYNSSKIRENTRFQILQLRNENEPEFIGMLIPNRVKEIPTNVLVSYYKRIKDEKSKLHLEDTNDVDLRISNGRKYFKQIHIKIFQQCRNMPNNLTYDDVVNERLLSYFQNYIKVMLQNFLNWFKIKPDVSKSLPQLGIRKNDIGESMKATSAKLIVTIISAMNIPNKITLEKSKSHQIMENGNSEIIVSHVNVIYDDVLLETAVKEGKNPIWNEQMVFPLRTSNIDYLNPNALHDSIQINMFMSIFNKDDQQIGHNWLGSIKIPLSAIAYNGKMEGFFLLKSPIFLNYERNLIYLNLKLKIEPNFPKMSINLKGLPCSEPPYLQTYLNYWNEDYNNNYPEKSFSIYALNSVGKTVCLTRFVQPLEPPQMNSIDFDISQEQCVRYISLIPFSDCNKLYDNIWLTTEEMLNLMIGTVIDHSIALTCFFLALNMEAWLLLGYGIPHGTTAYALVREHDSNNVTTHYIYDTSTAVKYNVTDRHCPLQKVFCVVNGTNIWANVQPIRDITLLQFDFSRKSDWQCVFNNQVSAPINSIQKKLEYRYRNSDVQDLQFQLEKKLKRKILKLRKTKKTIWNHHISNQLKNYITNLEKSYTLNKIDISHMKGIEHAHGVVNVYGYIVDLPYNIKSIMDVIEASQVFNADESDREYLFGLQLCLYPNQVLVVCMIVGFTVRK